MLGKYPDLGVAVAAVEFVRRRLGRNFNGGFVPKQDPLGAGPLSQQNF